MDWVERLITLLQQVPPLGALGLMFLIAYIENIFPPSPSDMLLVFCGTLIGIGTVGFFPSLLASTLGSTLGFMTAYAVGRYFEQHIVEGRFSRYLPMNAIAQVERWFQRFGYGVIVANRFLSGTRAVVSFFAGMSRMNFAVTTALCAVSAAVWNALLLYFGLALGNNWRRAIDYMALYSKVATIIVVVVIIVLCLWWYLRRKRNSAPPAPAD